MMATDLGIYTTTIDKITLHSRSLGRGINRDMRAIRFMSVFSSHTIKCK